MSSNPTQPKFGDQGEGVSFPPEDDAEGHRMASHAEGDGQPDGFRAAVADQEGDTEGHVRVAFVDGRPAGQPDGLRQLADSEDDDTEGHRVSSHVDGGSDGGNDGFAAR